MIGIIGVGVVGKAIYDAFSQHFGSRVYGYDKFKEDYNQSFDIVTKTNVTFVCVPTPTNNGVQDLDALNEVLEFLKSSNYQGVVILKCTVLPGTTQSLIDKYKLRIVHSPEFLTAKTPLNDFINQKVILLGGGTYEELKEVIGYFRAINPYSNVQWYPSPTFTELQKYMHNMFLALKVSFCNEIYEVCQMLEIPYTEVLRGTIAIGQIGDNHVRVPGPDGQVGFGGMCFPKDSEAYISFAHKLGVPVETIVGAVTGNKRRRPQP